MFKSKVAPADSTYQKFGRMKEKLSQKVEDSLVVKKEKTSHTSSNDIMLISNMQNGLVAEKLKEIANNLSARTEKAKEYVTQPPTPSTGASEKESLKAPKPPPLKHRPTVSTLTKKEDIDELEIKSRKAKLHRLYSRLKTTLTSFGTIEPQSRLNICWLFIACSSYLYNAWMVPMRSIFSEYQTKENLPFWLTLDYLCDFIYIIDIVVFKVRVKFLKDGTWVTELKEIRKAYLKSSRFAIDLVSLFPLDILYFFYGPISIFRFPRLFKISVFWEFFDRVDSVLSNPFIARLIRSIIYMVYTIHVYALVYYGFSKYEGIGSNSWVFQGEGNAYARCYFFAIKTATSIGKNPKPVNIKEQALMTVAWLSGVFVFAVLIGQVKDIVLTATKNQDEYRRIVDQTINYLNKFNVPESVIDKVRLWFSYTWKTQKTLDEIRALKILPVKLQLDLAINVHIQTLSKVQLFQDCDENLLRDLVLKLKPVIYLPGDYVCKKGEVGKEMYIVKTGEVQVVGGPKGDTVFVTLSEGSVFGEISLLALAGGNRRTADVRSHGFSNIFVLSKEDLQSTIKDHPEAQQVLKKKASRLIKETKEREKSPSIKEKKEKTEVEKLLKKSPKLLHAVFKIAKRGSITDSIRIRSLKLRSNPSSSPEKDYFEDNVLDDDNNILAIETESFIVNKTEAKEMKISNDVFHSRNLNISKDLDSSSITELQDHDEWNENANGNSAGSVQILRSFDDNINFIPDEERITYSLRKDGEKSNSLKSNNLLDSLENVHEDSREKNRSSKRKGIIDLGESVESEDWTQTCLDSPKSFEFREIKKRTKKEETNFSFESFSSSRESLDLFTTDCNITNFSFDPEINKFGN